MRKTAFSLVLLALVSIISAAHGVTVPYTEDFTTTNAGWRQNISANFADFKPSGGPDGSSYISSSYSFVGNLEDDGPVLHRANIADNASGGNFYGNWITAGATKFSAYVRHNVTEPVSYFARFTGASAFPGIIVFQPILVQPNTWTLLNFDASPSSPDLFFEGGNYVSIFSNVSRVQFGANVSALLAGLDQTFTFDVDKVTVNIPEPSALALSCLGLIGVVARRRNPS